MLFACQDIGNPDAPDATIVFGESIAQVHIGDTSADVIRKLGHPDRIVDGDFNGVVYHYTEGALARMFVGVSLDSALGLGVVGVNVEAPYRGRTLDGIGIDSGRESVLLKIGKPDTAYGEGYVRYDDYYFARTTFTMEYLNQKVRRISMSIPRHR